MTKQNVTDAVKATPGIIVPDAKGVCDALQNSSSTALGLTDKRSGIDLVGLKHSVEEHDTDLRRCHSDIQLADGMTKKKMSCRILLFLRNPRWKLFLDTTCTSSKKRAQMEVHPLDDLSTVRPLDHDGVLMLFHSIEHGILADTKSDRSQNPGRAGRHKWWKHDAWNLCTTIVTTGSGTNELDPGSVSVPFAFFVVLSEREHNSYIRVTFLPDSFLERLFVSFARSNSLGSRLNDRLNSLIIFEKRQLRR